MFEDIGDSNTSAIDAHGVGFLITDIGRRLRRAFQKRMVGNSLTLAQARALVYVSRHCGIRQVDLADMLEVQPITLARLIDQLEQQGLVERRSDPNDRRAYQLHPTDKAEPHIQEIFTVIDGIRQDVLAGFNEQELALLSNVLTRMRDRLDKR